MRVSVAAAVLVIATAGSVRALMSARTRAAALGRMPGRLQRSAPAAPVAAATVSRWKSRRERRGDVDVAMLARAMARGLRSGDSPAQALVQAVDTTPRARGLRSVSEHACTTGVASACEQWRASDPRPGVRLMTAAIAIGLATGGALARALDGVADTIEARAAVAQESFAQAATARASAAVLVVAPLVFGGFATAGDASAIAFLLRTPAGLTCLAAAVALDVLGALWMARITAASD